MDRDSNDSQPGSDPIRAAVAAQVANLAEWAAGVARRDIPDEVMRHAALVLFDDLAAMLAARSEPEVVALQAQLLAASGPPEATLFNGGGIRADRYTSAVANAAAADWCELDEGYRVTTCHAGLYVLPALMAEAEAASIPLADLLRILVVAYEVATRFARGFPTTTAALHPHGCFAALGAATATALARECSAAALRDAITSASTLVHPGPFNHATEGALVRNLWPATAAWTGMRAVDWAAIGIAGLKTSPFDVYVGGFGSETDPAAFGDGLGASWAITQNFQKLYACCQYGHATVEASLALRQELGDGGPRDIASIEVATHERGRQLDSREPATTLGAKFSIPHVAAATAVLGHAGADAFGTEALSDARIARLRDKVALAPFEPALPPPNDRPARVTWQLADGRKLEAECLSARGGPDRPFAREDILEKIRSLAGPVYPAMATLAKAAVAGDRAVWQRSWRDLVAEFTRPGEDAP